jgi:prepilin-type N-terminal cleavage/methylation domain-containing protein
MKTTQQRNPRSGFTLIEMVGVLAVIAILAALLVPKIFAAIEESRYTNAVGSLNSVKAATMDYFSKNGGFSPISAFDQVLISAGYLETPFKTRIGTGWACEVITASGDPQDGEGQYDLDGDGTEDITDQNVVQCKISGVNASDALELSKRLDGGDAITGMSELSAGADVKGRVVYKKPTDGKTDVYIYIAHK